MPAWCNPAAAIVIGEIPRARVRKCPCFKRIITPSPFLPFLLYGLDPRSDEDFGIHVGMLTLRGERGALLVSAEQLNRLTCNPFFSYLQARVAANVPTVAAAP